MALSFVNNLILWFKCWVLLGVYFLSIPLISYSFLFWHTMVFFAFFYFFLFRGNIIFFIGVKKFKLRYYNSPAKKHNFFYSWDCCRFFILVTSVFILYFLICVYLLWFIVILRFICFIYVGNYVLNLCWPLVFF